MPEFVTVASEAEIGEGDRIVVEVNNHYVAIFRVSDRYYAIEDVCTHDDGPLAEGELQGTVIECPRHGATFDITTGKALSLPAVAPVPRYEVRLEKGEIQIKI
jgi:3-phenylpropionate/trans-cinnamate dioxygenase ferredoxin subunit